MRVQRHGVSVIESIMRYEMREKNKNKIKKNPILNLK
jgi:hypothetical protein